MDNAPLGFVRLRRGIVVRCFGVMGGYYVDGVSDERDVGLRPGLREEKRGLCSYLQSGECSSTISIVPTMPGSLQLEW